jgi:hypothetical protein
MNEPVYSRDRSFAIESDTNQAPEALSPPEQTPDIFSFLNTVGAETDEFGRRLQHSPDGFDGMTLTGAGARILGNGLQLSAALGAELNSEMQHQRVDRAFEKFGELDQRLHHLSRALQAEDLGEPRQNEEKRGIAKPQKKIVEPAAHAAATSTERTAQLTFDQVLTHPLQQFDQRLQKLEKQVGVSSPPSLVQIDPNLSINQKIDRIEAAITQMSDRLDRLEQWVERVQSSAPTQPSNTEENAIAHEDPAGDPAPTQTENQVQESIPAPSQKIEGVAIAQKLQNFVESRAQYLDKSPQEPVITTLGKVSLTQDSNSTTLSIESDRYDEKFAATRTDDGWTTTRNDLSPSEAERLLKLPQTSEEYRGWIASKTLISELAQSFPEQFNQPLGVLSWEAENAQYQMTIHLHEDHSRQILVDRQSGDDRQTVLAAKITPDQVTEIEHTELNPDITEYQANVLHRQRAHESKTTHQLAQ